MSAKWHQSSTGSDSIMLIQLHCNIFHIIFRHVGEYMVRKARNKNKNLLVFAELFTGDNIKDA